MVDWPEWPWSSKGDNEESGKFVRHTELQPGCAPLGVLTVGLREDDLEVLADAVESVWDGMDAHIPIAVLAQTDVRRQLRDILAKLDRVDSVIPDRPCTPRVPLVLLSGFSTTQTSATIRALRACSLRGGESGQESPMFAVVVPNALSKTLRVLLDELDGDHRENAAAAERT